ncbi:MAG: aspartyl protease family protein [Treponema sp.]|jgi:predicted aspartyl protease|nr:aspartyl protease family protein [Treponema sp.]
MGEVVEKITLVNALDAGMARHGIIKESDVRQVTVDAVVDTGAGPLVITEAMRQKLGLEIVKDSSVHLAGDVPQKCTVAEVVKIIWKDRYSHSDPTVLPAGHETLLGVIPLEDMDLMVNPVKRCLVGAHGDEWVRQVRALDRRTPSTRPFGSSMVQRFNGNSC